MSNTAEEQTVESAGRARRFSLRADLRIEAQTYAGELNYVVKDPIALTYYRFRPTEHDILKLIDDRTAAEICELVKSGLLAVEMNEEGHPWQEVNDNSFVWRGWFRMTPQGQSLWESMEPASLSKAATFQQESQVRE